MAGPASAPRLALAGVARVARAAQARLPCRAWGAACGAAQLRTVVARAHLHACVGSGNTALSGAMRPLHFVIAQMTPTARARVGLGCPPSHAHVLVVPRPPVGRGSRGGSGRQFSAGPKRPLSRYQEEMRKKNRQVALYMGGLTLFTISFTYLSVPLYRIFCAKTGFAGTVKPQDQVEYEAKAKPVSGKRVLTVKFNSDTSITMPWKFLPDQHEIKVLPGEAALAFFTAENKTPDPIIGVASYNIQPDGAALYFNKIQCFCFEEQMLKGKEKVDMPVFFFIDPDFLADKSMDHVDTITLSYTFFKAGDADAPEVAGMHMPLLPARDKQVAAAAAAR